MARTLSELEKSVLGKISGFSWESPHTRRAMKGKHLYELDRGDCGRIGRARPRVREANQRTGQGSFTNSASSASTAKLTFLSRTTRSLPWNRKLWKCS